MILDYENACAEFFFSSLKKDKLYGCKFKIRDDARIATVEYKSSKNISKIIIKI